jgi:hypothetical protein
MRRILSLAFVLCALGAPVLAEPGPPTADMPRASCVDRGTAAQGREIQLAQSDCRGNCSSSRGYCMSTCRDSFCRAVCNDRYQSCLSSCRR